MFVNASLVAGVVDCDQIMPGKCVFNRTRLLNCMLNVNRCASG